MKKGDFYWIFALLIWVVILVVPASRAAFMGFTGAHPYIGGFIKFSILATMGDLLGTRLVKGDYVIPKGLIYRAMIWGFLGMMISLVFIVFMEGVGIAQKAKLLPFEGYILAQAFFGSSIMNLSFGPMLSIFHKFLDLIVDTKYEHKEKITLSKLVDKVNWRSMVEFNWVKTCVLFWIPVHTIVFTLPKEYRVLVSAFLSIALGILLSIAKNQNQRAPEAAV